MESDETAVVAEPAAAEPPAPSADAPWGYKPDGVTPYKRDPSFFAHLRGKQPGGRRNVRKTPAGVKPAERPAQSAPAPRKGKPEYAKKLVEWGQLGIGLVKDPVEREIVREHLPRVALKLEQAALQSPALAAILDKLMLTDMGGVWIDLGLEILVPTGLVMMNRGVNHPMLTMFLGAQLQQLVLRAAEQQKADQAAEAKLRAMLAQGQPAEPAPDVPPHRFGEEAPAVAGW